MSQSKPYILLLFTNHRVAEKLYHVIPELSKHFRIDLFSVGLFSINTPWVGTTDERVLFKKIYSKFIDKQIEGPGIRFHGDRINNPLAPYLDINKYSLVIYDDNRLMQEFNIPSLYSVFNTNNIPVVANSHGNEEYRRYDAEGKSFDYLFTLGYKEKFILEKNFSHLNLLEGGIPTNDRLKGLRKRPQHILVITNYLGNRDSIFPVNFDKHFVKQAGLEELSAFHKLPIVVKQKARLDDPDFIKNEEYIKSLLKCRVITNSDISTDQLIADSKFVVSAQSTLAFKPIQLNIPTAVIKGTGQNGNFYNYPDLVDLDKIEIFATFGKKTNYKKFVETTIAGGANFTSCKQYVSEILKLI